MEKFFLALLGVGFSELRQIAVTFCHSNVMALAADLSIVRER